MAGKANVFLPFVLGDYACHLNLMTLGSPLAFLSSQLSYIRFRLASLHPSISNYSRINTLVSFLWENGQYQPDTAHLMLF